MLLFLISGVDKEINTATYFGGTTLPGTPQMDTPKINFLNCLTLGASFFGISTYLREKYFDMLWGYQLFRDPPKMEPPKINFLNDLI